MMVTQGTSLAVPVTYHKRKKEYFNVGQYCYIDYASGQLSISAQDMATWASNMLHYGTPTLWSNATGQTETHCQEQDASGNPAKPCSTGTGWIRLDNSMKGEKYVRSFPSFDKYDWTDGIWYDGGEVGVNTQLAVLPKAGVFVALLTNTDENAGDWAAQILSGALINAPLPGQGTGSEPATSTSSSSRWLLPTQTCVEMFSMVSSGSIVILDTKAVLG